MKPKRVLDTKYKLIGFRRIKSHIWQICPVIMLALQIS